jgi:phosphocarrier protein FPr
MPAIPAVKAQIRTRLADCQRLAEFALAADSAADVRALVASHPGAQPVQGNGA